MDDTVATTLIPETPASQAAAAHLVTLTTAALDTIREHEDALAQLDSIAGDGDHGRGMVRGLDAARTAATTVAATKGTSM